MHYKKRKTNFDNGVNFTPIAYTKANLTINQTAPFGALNAVTSGNAPLNFSIFTSPV